MSTGRETAGRIDADRIYSELRNQLHPCDYDDYYVACLEAKSVIP